MARYAKMSVMAGKELDIILHNWGIVRGPGESDEHLRMRVKTAMLWPVTMNHSYMQLCYLLLRLGVRSARRDLPMGTI